MREATSDRQIPHIKFAIDKKMQAMIEGCKNVQESKDIHQDAKDLAKEVIKDCNKVLEFLNNAIRLYDE